MPKHIKSCEVLKFEVSKIIIFLQDTHKYYSSSFVPYEHTWVDLDVLNASGKAVVQVTSL